MRRALRLFQIVRVFLRHRLVPGFRRRGAAPPPPQVRLRLAFEELGGAWLKLGQALALRFDLLPDAYCYELFKLLNEVRPFSFEHVERIIEADLGAPVGQLFAVFEREPFASASIGQVHRAELRSGERVAVKVQRPDIERRIAVDIALMHLLARLTDAVDIWGGTRATAVVEEFARWTQDELDYRIEADHARVLAANADGDRIERNARVYPRFSGRRVMTMERMDGIPLIDVLYARRDGDEHYLEELEADGHDLKRIARHLLWNAMNQIYQFGVFHADLHPANLFVMKGDAIGYVDFGIVGRLPGRLRESLAAYARHLFEGDVDRAVDELLRWLAPSERTAIAAARADLVRATDRYLLTLRSRRRRGAAGVASLEADLLRILRSHRLTLAPDAITYIKAVVASTTVIYAIDPDFDLVAHEAAFHNRLVAQEVARWLKPREAARLAYDIALRTSRLLDAAGSVEATEAVITAAAEVRGRLQLLAAIGAVAGLGIFAAQKRADAVADVLGRSATLWLPAALLLLLVAVVIGIVREGRRLPTRERRRGRHPA